MYCNVYALAPINSFHRGGRQNISSKASERIIFPHKYRPLINYNIKKNLDTGTYKIVRYVSDHRAIP